MSDNKNIVDEIIDLDLSVDDRNWVESAHRVFLAGIGALSMAQGGLTDFAGDSEKFVSRLVADTEQFINKLVERGTIAEQDGRALINNMVEARTSQVKGGVKSVGEGADKRIEAVLTRMNIPSRNDINKLSGKISALAEKVDQLL